MAYRYKYLHQESANDMYKMIADQIIQDGSVLDLGCGHTRWLEHYKGNAKVVGVDSNKEVIDYCKSTYKGHKFYNNDISKFNSKKKFDVIVLGGILYYSKNMLQDVEALVKKYSPKYIVIQEPLSITHYNAPDILPLLNEYSWTMQYLHCDIRMGERVVIKLDTTKKLLKQIPKQTDDYFDDHTLINGVYLVNTESISTQTDGIITDTHQYQLYTSVCAGFKSMYHACLNWDKTSDIEFEWVDISPTALMFRQFMNRCLLENHTASFNEIWHRFKAEMNANALSITGDVDIDSVVLTQLTELHISPYKWNMFLEKYAQGKHRYTRMDIVENMDQFVDFIKPNCWLWFSNAFDWHQFASSDEQFWKWHNMLVDKNVIPVGKFPPFKNSSIPWGTKSQQELHVFESINNEGLSWWLANSQEVIDWNTFVNTELNQRQNEYCTTYFNTHGKIKIFKGNNCNWAKSSHHQLEHLYQTKYHWYHKDDTMVECHSWYWGETVADILRDLKHTQHFTYILINERMANLCADFILNIAKYVNSNNEVYYSKDLKMENIVYDAQENRFVQIDFDYAISTSYNDFLTYARDYMINDIFRQDMGHVLLDNLNRYVIEEMINERLGLQ